MKELVYEIIVEIKEPASGSDQDHTDAVISHFEDSIRESKVHNTDTMLQVKSLKLISGDKHSVRIERSAVRDLLLESKNKKQDKPDPNPNYLLRVKQRLRNKAHKTE